MRHAVVASVAVGARDVRPQASRSGSLDHAWPSPVKILDGDMKMVHWYPQVIGADAAAQETDKRAGRVARLFVKGASHWEIAFKRAGEP